MVQIWQLIGGGPLAAGSPSHGTTGTMMDNLALQQSARTHNNYIIIIIIIIYSLLQS